MGPNGRKSFLTLEPVNLSLTEGTNIPPPPESPVKPASSRIDETQSKNLAETTPQTPELHASDSSKERADSLRTPLSPASTGRRASPRQGKPRKLFSLSNLRQSFSSSRTSLNVSRPSTENGRTHGAKRPTSPNASFSTNTSTGREARLQPDRKIKSNNWFKRKSGFLLNGGGDHGLASVQEGQRPSTDESRRARENSPAPLLPEIGTLSGGGLNGGGFGWDEKIARQ